MTKHFPISFHPEIFKILGEQLVSDPVIAIQELVKNAYDADSNSCDITIDTINEQIMIEDKGHGMTEKNIEKGWLVVGTPLKRITDKSKSGKRFLTGSMGVGRLASFSLGNVVEIITTSNEDKITRNFKMTLSELLNLNNFDDYYIDIEENKYKREKGTIIIIKELKNIFSKEFKTRLKRMLSILVVPNKKNIFTITIKYDSEKKIVLDPQTELAQYHIKVTCNVDKIGIAYIDIDSNKNSYLGKKDLSHKTKIILKKYLELKLVNIELFWYLHASRETSFWTGVPSGFSQDMRAGLSGIRIYRDGVRVLPYGEIEDDSFNIDKRYVSLGAKAKRPRNVQFIGWIYISRKNNPNLIDTSNREGLVNNSAYLELSNLIDDVINEFIDYRIIVEETPKDKKITASDTQIIQTKLKSMKKQINLITKDKKELPKNITHEKLEIQLNKNVESLTEYIEKVDQLLDVESLYRDRVTAGNMINNILHYVGSATSASKEFIELAMNEKCNIKSHDVAFSSIMDLLPRIQAAYDILKGGSITGGKKTFNVYDKTISLVENLRITSSMKPKQIIVNCENFDVDMRESDYWAIVANLLINSITCHDYEHATGIIFAPKNKREIILTISTLNNNLIIQCEDNGPGLPDKPLGWIWQQFTSTRKPIGSGLGLFIISEIVDYYGGMKIATSSQKYPSGAHFYIQLNDVVI